MEDLLLNDVSCVSMLYEYYAKCCEGQPSWVDLSNYCHQQFSGGFSID